MKLLIAACSALLASMPAWTWGDPFADTWCRYVTPRLNLVTNLRRSHVDDLVEQMEVFRAIADSFIYAGGRDGDVPLKVVAFSQRADFKAVMNAPQFAGFMHGSLVENTLIFGPQTGKRLLHESAQHEYTHHLLRNRVDAKIPIWYDEGLATFLSTVRLTGRHVQVGRAPGWPVGDLVSSSRVDVRRLIESHDAYRWADDELRDFYAMAWLLLHFIQLGHTAGFDDWRGSLSEYLRTATVPFEQAFGTSYAELQALLQRYTRDGQVPTIRVPRPEVAVTLREAECLSEHERDLELAGLMIGRNAEQAEAVMQRLLADDAADVKVLIALAKLERERGRTDQALDYSRRALAAAADDPAAQIELASSLAHGCALLRIRGCAERWDEATALFRKALRADPQRFDAALGVGISYLHTAQPGNALNYLRIAYQKAPWSPYINFYLGEAYRLVGDRRAGAHLNNALAWTRDATLQRLAEAAMTELERETSPPAP